MGLSRPIKEYYAYASGEAAPKPKASARRKRSGSDSSTTPPTTVASPRPTIVATSKLTAAAKGKQPAKAKSPSDPSELARTEAQQLKIVLRRSRQETHISQHGGSVQMKELILNQGFWMYPLIILKKKSHGTL
nr:hypothetical protein [Tanacetum cinerariifolium]